MATNVEIKARVRDLDGLRETVEMLSDTPPLGIPQDDTFFHTATGRLKLRVLAKNEGQLVYYEREDTPGPKESHYLVAPVSDPQALKAVLASALGVRGTVCKQRTLYRVGQTRIHLDQVEALGPFLELEVVLRQDQTEADGRAIARTLMRKLGIEREDLVEDAYIDLLERKAS
jgi:predicted adenylyl cyclase CyaB